LRRAALLLAAGAALAIAAAAPTASASTTLAVPKPVTGIVYGRLQNEILAVFPAAKAGSPIEIQVHGGWWYLQENEVEHEKQAVYMQRQGFEVVDILYPEATWTLPAFPGQPQAVQDAVRWTQSHGAKYGGDTTKIVVLGASSGGNISLLGAAAVDRSTPGVVRAVATLSAPTDLRSLAAYETRLHETSRTSGYGNLGRALGCRGLPASCEPAEREWSPVNHIEKGTCPALYAAGSETDFIPFSQQTELKEAALAHGCPITLREVPEGHAFGYWSQVRGELAAFFKAHV
jgi:acetyl esterase/lipase